MIEIKEYVLENDESPFRDWFDELDPQAAVGVETAIRRLSEANTSNVKSIGEGAAELKINRGPGYRVYFGWDGKVLVILLGGGTKRRQTKRYRSRVASLARLQASQIRQEE